MRSLRGTRSTSSTSSFFFLSLISLRLQHKYRYVCSYGDELTKGHFIIIYNNISLLSNHSHTQTHTNALPPLRQKIDDYCEPTGFKQLVKCYNDGEEESTAWIPCEEPEGEDAGLHAFLGFEVMAIVVALVSGYYVWKTRRRHRAKKQSHLYSIIGTPSRK